ncbi:MAG: DegQ family serine endoprotease [Pseudoxanthomonas sp.]
MNPTNPRARNGLLGLLILTMPLAACARPATNAAAPAVTSSIAQSSAPQIVTGLPDFTKLVETVGPGVVKISVKSTPKIQQAQGRNRNRQMPGEDDMPEFFRRFFGQDFDGGFPFRQQPQPSAGLGSGFIISPDGYVMTNNHVIQGADTVTVTLSDKREFRAKVIGSDKQYDVALLKIDGSNLPSIRIGNSDALKAGQWVVAIGAPFGFDNSVTAGIVSALGRTTGPVGFIQTDVAVNPGNSGGPLLNTSGEVVGINSQIYTESGGYMGVSFAIPINVAMKSADQLKKTGKVSHGQIGVVVGPISADSAKGFNLPDTHGALVQEVQKGSAGEKAGLQPGDVIRSVDGKPILDSTQLPPLISAMPAGSKVTVGVFRNGGLRNFDVVLTQLKGSDGDDAESEGDDDSSDQPEEAAQARSSLLGLEVADLSADDRRQLRLDAGQGVQITDITGQAAADAGLQRGLIVLQVGHAKVSNVAAFNKALAGVKPGDVVMLLVRSPQGRSQFVAVTAGNGKD